MELIEKGIQKNTNFVKNTNFYLQQLRKNELSNIFALFSTLEKKERRIVCASVTITSARHCACVSTQ